MSNYINQFLFGYYPYICIVVFLVTSLARYEYAQYGWKTGSSQMLSNEGFLFASNTFHVGIILLFFGHFFGLLTPHNLYSKIISAETKQLVAMIMGGIFGVICFVGCTFILYRRLFNNRVRRVGSLSDILVLIIIYTQLILGLFTILISANHLDGSSMMNMANWAQCIILFKSSAYSFIINEHIVFKMHIFLGMTIFLIFPFTRLVHIFSIPVKYVFSTEYQIVRKRT